MVFVNSFRLLGSNWKKALKFFLYYVVVLGIVAVLFLPTFLGMKSVFKNYLGDVQDCLAGVFGGAIGKNIDKLIENSISLVGDIFAKNLGLSIYGLIVIFVLLPIFVNVGKYTFDFMLYSYMTSKNEVGFWSALVKNLKTSALFSFFKIVYNVIFVAVVCTILFGFSKVNASFVSVGLPIFSVLLLALLFSLSQMVMLGITPALIVFDCSVPVALKKGWKAAWRHFWVLLGTTFCCFFAMWLLVLIFGVYSLVVLAPAITIIMEVYSVTAFFTSQGMRFYVNDSQILTPKKLEEVDDINKTAFIL